MNCVIFGAGAWGTAMAIHLARQSHTVTLVPRRLEHALTLASTRENTDYLPGQRLEDSIQIGLEPLPALMDTEPPCWPAPPLEPAITDTEPADPDNESPDETFTAPDEPEALPLDTDTEPEPAPPTEEAERSNTAPLAPV